MTILATREAVIAWAVARWQSEVANRPLQNVHRRALDTTWRQVIRHLGGDDVMLCGPAHDELQKLATLDWKQDQAETSRLPPEKCPRCSFTRGRTCSDAHCPDIYS